MSSGTLGIWQRLVIKGTSPGSEIWQTGVSMEALTVPASQADLQSLLNTIAPFVATWWTSVKTTVYSTFKYTGCVMYQYSGTNPAAVYQAVKAVSPVAGSLAGVGSPIDTCCVVSLRSDFPGRAGRGRMYVPAHDPADSSGMFSSASTNTNIGTATKTLLSSIASGTTAVPVVASRATNSWYSISAIDTDNKPDVQRRRENRLLPTSTQVLAFP